MDYGRRGLRGAGEDCLKYPKRGWNRKEGRGNKDFKKGAYLSQGVVALKRGGGNPLRTMADGKCGIEMETPPKS